MSFQALCSCGVKYTLNDAKQGKRLRCKHCGATFLAEPLEGAKKEKKAPPTDVREEEVLLSTEEKARCLAQGIFQGLPAAILHAMASRMGERSLEDGEILFLKGEPGDEIFVVVEGEIEIFIEDQVIAVLGPGQLFGEMAVLGGGKRTASGRAKGATRLLFLKEKAMKLLIQQSPDLAFAIFRVLIARLEEANRLALFLGKEHHPLAWIEILAGDLSTKRFPLYHKEAVVGRAIGSVAADALRLALPTSCPSLLERHAFIALEENAAYITPLDGEVKVNGETIEDTLQIEPEDEVTLGTLTFHVKIV